MCRTKWYQLVQEKPEDLNAYLQVYYSHPFFDIASFCASRRISLTCLTFSIMSKAGGMALRAP